jgi:hypothetical protein
VNEEEEEYEYESESEPWTEDEVKFDEKKKAVPHQ